MFRPVCYFAFCIEDVWSPFHIHLPKLMNGGECIAYGSWQATHWHVKGFEWSQQYPKRVSRYEQYAQQTNGWGKKTASDIRHHHLHFVFFFFVFFLCVCMLLHFRGITPVLSYGLLRSLWKVTEPCLMMKGWSRILSVYSFFCQGVFQHYVKIGRYVA